MSVPYGYKKYRKSTGQVVLRKNLKEQKTIMKMKELFNRHRNYMIVSHLMNDLLLLRRDEHWTDITVSSVIKNEKITY
jgi:hypothetical protein